ncbi:MAG: SDR family oxidoreductase [Nitrospinae bacterium]|nr:SDR family oxidoreductase [Nitrospinota bacterium]MBL7020314.1 SDR family oxidoreductase [Nitrospinaceae bacterium]
MPTAIVTGGAIRIGRAMGLHLARKGFNIALLYHSSGTAGEETIAEARSQGVQCQGYVVDLRNLEETELLIGKILNDFDDVELLVNSAANFIQENVAQTRLETLVDTLNLNLMAPYLLMREYKRKVNKGLIVNILDERVARTLPTFAAYSVSKVGLKHLTELAAVEWGKSVRVNGIAPGLILPPQGGPPDYLEKAAKKVPTGTHGSLEDLIKALDYLMGNTFVNGETLFVDGGESL